VSTYLESMSRDKRVVIVNSLLRGSIDYNLGGTA